MVFVKGFGIFPSFGRKNYLITLELQQKGNTSIQRAARKTWYLTDSIQSKASREASEFFPPTEHLPEKSIQGLLRILGVQPLIHIGIFPFRRSSFHICLNRTRKTIGPHILTLDLMIDRFAFGPAFEESAVAATFFIEPSGVNRERIAQIVTDRYISILPQQQMKMIGH